ncbi:MAG: 2Fe-2S iron-sulfur cluster binding domain-containing protein, partial [Symploca sp. SIO2B6]|nr:2Fe-2S iron-sulfur cluster binding domain-containing protein [Symploca sp. SIO2B6]
MHTQTDLIFSVNGTQMHLQGVSPTQTLLSYLRQHQLVGTKEGCGDGDCGACTVVMVGSGSDSQAHYQAVNSCLIPVGALAGRDIYTVEGLSAKSLTEESITNGALHPVQQAMVELGGSQCGYCTPGFIMSLFAGYYDRRLDDEVVEGNLCRCTGYLPIRRAAQQVVTEQGAAERQDGKPIDTFAQRLAEAAVQLEAIAYSHQDQRFYRPTQLADVLALLQD